MVVVGIWGGGVERASWIHRFATGTILWWWWGLGGGGVRKGFLDPQICHRHNSMVVVGVGGGVRKGFLDLQIKTVILCPIPLKGFGCGCGGGGVGGGGGGRKGFLDPQICHTVLCRGNIPRPVGRGSRVAGDPRVESKTDMHILINQPAGARVRASLVYNVVTICFTGFGYPKHIKTFRIKFQATVVLCKLRTLMRCEVA